MIRGTCVFLFLMLALSTQAAYFKGHSYSGDIIAQGETLLILSEGIVDGIQIRTPGEVSFTDASADIFIKGDSFIATKPIDAQFLPGNSFIDVIKGQHLRIYARFSVEQEKIRADEFTLENGIYILIENGAYELLGTNSSVLLTIESHDKRFLFDDRQNFVMQKNTEKILSYGEIAAKAREQIPVPLLKDSAYALNKWNQFVHRLPSTVHDSIHELRIISPTEIEEECGEFSGGCSFESTVIVPYDTTFPTFYHEAAHAYVHLLDKLEPTPSKAYLQLVKIRAQLRKKYGMDTTLITAPEKKLLRQAEQAYTAEDVQTFRERWEDIAKNAYGKDMGSRHIGGKHAQKWSNGSEDPRFGCINAYGCNNLDEDVATFVEEINKDSSRLREIMASSDKRYSQKLLLLISYGFIEEDAFVK